MTADMMKQMAGLGMRDRMKFAQQMGQMASTGAPPALKTKQRSKRLTNKEKAKRKKQRRRGR